MNEDEQTIAGGWLIRELRTRSRLGQAEFAARAGLNQTVLSRIESGAQDPGFAAVQQWILAATDYRVVLDAVPDPLQPRSGADNRLAADPLLLRVSDERVKELMPRALRPSIGRFEYDQPAGPAADAAIYWQLQVQRLNARAREPAARLQVAWSTFHDERDRDLIHQLGNCGAGATQAADVLGACLRDLSPAPRRRGRGKHAGPPRIGQLVWCHVVYAVAIEALICQSAAAFCRAGAEATEQHQRALLEVTRAQREVERTEQGARDTAMRHDAHDRLVEAQAGERATGERRADCGRVGGTPRLEQIGMAGERILAEEFTAISRAARGLYEQMADDTFRQCLYENALPTPDLDPNRHPISV